MKVYVDYNFYKNEYGGAMEEAAFKRAVSFASQYIRSVTLNKSDSYEGDELKFATCEIADLYTISGGEGDADSREVKSVSNDGFSVTYISEGKDGETTEDLRSRKAYKILRTWLLPTGLLTHGVNKRGCYHDDIIVY